MKCVLARIDTVRIMLPPDLLRGYFVQACRVVVLQAATEAGISVRRIDCVTALRDVTRDHLSSLQRPSLNLRPSRSMFSRGSLFAMRVAVVLHNSPNTYLASHSHSRKRGHRVHINCFSSPSQGQPRQLSPQCPELLSQKGHLPMPDIRFCDERLAWH